MEINFDQCFSARPNFLFSVIFCSISSIVIALCFSVFLEFGSNIPLSTLVLGLAPGSIAEIATTAKIHQLVVPLFSAFQVTRMALVVIVSGPLFKFR